MTSSAVPSGALPAKKYTASKPSLSEQENQSLLFDLIIISSKH